MPATCERNLYLLSQVLDLGLPTVVAVNMVDVAARRGIASTLPRLQERLGVPVVAVQANRRLGLGELKAALVEAIRRRGPPPALPFPEPFELEVAKLQGERLGSDANSLPLPRCLLAAAVVGCQRLFAKIPAAAGRRPNWPGDWPRPASVWPRPAAPCRAWRRRSATPGPVGPGGVVAEPRRWQVTASDRIDRILTHRLWGTLVFALVMLVVFQAVFVWARPLMKRDRHWPRRRWAAGSKPTWPTAPCAACWSTA